MFVLFREEEKKEIGPQWMQRVQ